MKILTMEPHINIAPFLFNQDVDPSDSIALKLAAFQNKELFDLIQTTIVQDTLEVGEDAVTTILAQVIDIIDEAFIKQILGIGADANEHLSGMHLLCIKTFDRTSRATSTKMLQP